MTIQKMIKLGLLQLGILLLLNGVGVQAQTDIESAPTQPQTNERVYQVEMIVFARPEVNAREHWPTELKLSYPENLVALKTEHNPDGFSLLPANERMLNPQASVLARSGTYTLLYHQAWRQPIYARKTNIFISGGKNVGGHQELEGSIALSVGQYLKIQTNLWLSQFAVPGTDVAENWPALPSLPFSDANSADKNQDYLLKRVVKIAEARSMRSNEVHYIDHPLLGIVIKIIPYDSANKTN